MTFPCEACGKLVVVAVKRNHRYCEDCSVARGATKKAEWQARKRETRSLVRGAEDWAEVETARILGVPVGPRTTCKGCGVPIPPKRGPGRGLPRMWCSDSCRVRVAGRGSIGATGYAGALLRDPCVYCGDAAAELDHVVAAAAGGSGEWHNLAPVCRRCNSQKKHMGLLRFMLARPLFVEADRIKAELTNLRVA